MIVVAALVVFGAWMRSGWVLSGGGWSWWCEVEGEVVRVAVAQSKMSMCYVASAVIFSIARSCNMLHRTL